MANVGKMRSAFGKVNTLHNHVLPWVDRPLVTTNLVGGEDGIDDAGFSLQRIIPAPMGTRANVNVETRETRYKMVEEFSDFKKEGELNLPHLYQIKLTVDSQGGTFLAEWTIKLTSFTFNQAIDPTSFSISMN